MIKKIAEFMIRDDPKCRAVIFNPKYADFFSKYQLAEPKSEMLSSNMHRRPSHTDNEYQASESDKSEEDESSISSDSQSGQKINTTFTAFKKNPVKKPHGMNWSHGKVINQSGLKFLHSNGLPRSKSAAQSSGIWQFRSSEEDE